MRILLVEDDELVAASLKRGLSKIYFVDIVNNIRVAHTKINEHSYDALLIDLQLPDGNGIELCKSLRSNGYNEPIIIVSGHASVNNKILLLDSGADDFITKPYSLAEMMARLRAVLRRTQVINENRIINGVIEINSAARIVKRSGVEIKLRRKEYDLLEYMLRHEGKTLTRAKILSQVWDGNGTAWANVVDVHIKHLRDKLDRPYDSHLIKTVHGVGYRLDTMDNSKPKKAP